MKKFKTIEEALNFLYNKQPLSYSDFVILPENKGNASLFAAYVRSQYYRFIDIVKAIDESTLSNAIKEFEEFQGNPSKRRFINLLKKISNDFFRILKECYSPNSAKALSDLEKLLGMNNRNLMQYLVEPLINYCSFDYPQNSILYRVRDAKIGEEIDNCWHTPFQIREKSYAGRFSSPGFPCLYLADSSETCCKEIKLNKGYARWLGEFRLKKKQTLICLDLTIPSESKIKTANYYEQIQLFLTFPLRILCTTYAEHKSDTFGEEYIFSQALINLLSFPLKDNSGLCRVSGIMYNSTKHKGGINIALPARSISIPPNPEERYSKYLQDMFSHAKPSKFDVNDGNSKTD